MQLGQALMLVHPLESLQVRLPASGQCKGAAVALLKAKAALIQFVFYFVPQGSLSQAVFNPIIHARFPKTSF